MVDLALEKFADVAKSHNNLYSSMCYDSKLLIDYVSSVAVVTTQKIVHSRLPHRHHARQEEGLKKF